MSAHALLSASSSHRWLACPPSARLNEREPDTTSEAAKEGTIAHACAEQKLRNFLAKSRKKVKCKDGEMDECTNGYRDYVVEIYQLERKKTKDALLMIEQKLDFSQWVPEGFGTADAVVIGDNTLHVIDFKYGKGVPVSAEDNPQLKLYGAGAMARYELLYGFEKVKVHIYQPRIDMITEAEYTIDELRQWAECVAAPRAQLAYLGAGNLCAGEHCKFCKVKARCIAQRDLMQELEERNAKLDAMLLTDDEIADVLPRVDGVAEWIKEVKEYALQQALEGTKYQGYKVVEGTSRRKIVDEGGLAKTLMTEGYQEDAIYKPKELQTITTLEKLVGKKNFAELSKGYVEKPQGKPTLVPESDKRPEWNAVEDDFADELK